MLLRSEGSATPMNMDELRCHRPRMSNYECASTPGRKMPTLRSARKYFAIRYRPHFGGETLDKVPVMDDGKNCTSKVLQRIFEAGARGDVEVVDWFIQYQKCTPLCHKQGKL